MSVYHEGQRALQDRFDSRRLADRLEERTYHQTLSDSDRAFIARSPMFFLATADDAGRPDVSYKGGIPGFVRILDGETLAFPSYDGNGQYRSLGNIAVNAAVSLLFVDFEDPSRLRLTGQATLQETDDENADLWVTVRIEQVWPNCPRYIHRMRLEELSVFAPRAEHTPPEPEWKQYFRDVLPRR